MVRVSISGVQEVSFSTGYGAIKQRVVAVLGSGIGSVGNETIDTRVAACAASLQTHQAAPYSRTGYHSTRIITVDVCEVRFNARSKVVNCSSATYIIMGSACASGIETSGLMGRNERRLALRNFSHDSRLLPGITKMIIPAFRLVKKTPQDCGAFKCDNVNDSFAVSVAYCLNNVRS